MTLLQQLAVMGIAALSLGAAAAETLTINLKPAKGDACASFSRAIERARRHNGPVEINLAPGVYNLSHDRAKARKYRISNTASATEHTTSLKHIGLLIKGIDNLTITGDGKATLLTHGEMTPWAIDSCTNIVFKGLIINAEDPTTPEATITERTDSTLTVSVHPDAEYEIRNGKLYWKGYGWEFTDGIAQVYFPDTDVTLRCASPVADADRAEEIEPGTVRFFFRGGAPDYQPGCTYHFRHSYRREAGGFINRSNNVAFMDMQFAFTANFGVVGQFSKNITFTDCRFAPLEGSGRTNAAYADFVHLSSCAGYVKVSGCYFAGSHDDDINIHGTHQQIVEASPKELKLRYMHPQTFGFLAYTAGDTIEIVNPHTLMPLERGVVADSRMTDEYHTVVTLREPISDASGIVGMVVDNITWYPTVEIRDNTFSRMPTRGILLTSRRSALIEGNRFMRCPMPAILIADDARSWYESGRVTDVVIRENLFVECSSPVIDIAPENDVIGGYVHGGICIEGNEFVSSAGATLKARSVDGLSIDRNKVVSPYGEERELTVDVTSSTAVTINE